jgi:hypothetical protein
MLLMMMGMILTRIRILRIKKLKKDIFYAEHMTADDMVFTDDEKDTAVLMTE